MLYKCCIMYKSYTLYPYALRQTLSSQREMCSSVGTSSLHPKMPALYWPAQSMWHLCIYVCGRNGHILWLWQWVRLQTSQASCWREVGLIPLWSHNDAGMRSLTTLLNLKSPSLTYLTHTFTLEAFCHIISSNVHLNLFWRNCKEGTASLSDLCTYHPAHSTVMVCSHYLTQWVRKTAGLHIHNTHIHVSPYIPY